VGLSNYEGLDENGEMIKEGWIEDLVNEKKI